MGIELYKPYLRAQMEADCKAISEGRKSRQEIYAECLKEMRKIFVRTHGMSAQFRQFFAQRFQDQNNVNVDRQNWGGGGGGPPGGGGNPGGGFDPGPGPRGDGGGGNGPPPSGRPGPA